MVNFIIDVNIDLNPNNRNFPKYFFDGIEKNHVTVVYGGRSYAKEIQKKHSLLKLLLELQRRSAAKKCDDEAVNQAERDLIDRISTMVPGGCPGECDDHHIFAIAKVSGCVNILSGDNRMALCRDKIRNRVGHQYCPSIRIVKTQEAYNNSR